MWLGLVGSKRPPCHRPVWRCNGKESKSHIWGIRENYRRVWSHIKMGRPRTLVAELQCSKQGSRAIFGIFGPPRQLWRHVELCVPSGGSRGYRPWTLRIWSQNCVVIIPGWRHNTLPTLDWPLMYRAILIKIHFFLLQSKLDFFTFSSCQCFSFLQKLLYLRKSMFN